MRSRTLDPMAGERARATHLDRGAVRAVTDPTDPRFGVRRIVAAERVPDAHRIVDPTDPDCGRRLD